MEVTKELIDKFLSTKCTTLEVEAIIMYFNENKKTLDNYLSKEEWDCISMSENLDSGKSEIILNKLRNYLFQKPLSHPVTIKRNAIQWLAAACIMIVIGLASYIQLYVRNPPKNGQTVKIYKADYNTTTGIKKEIKWQVHTNKSNLSQKIKLADGSIVTLYKYGTISYPETYGDSKREILLSGDAFFMVAKNKEKPFIVYSGSISTTALGTSFRITVFDQANKHIQVKLFTGSVVVQSTTNLKTWKKDIILKPGQQVAYNGENNPIEITQFTIEKEKLTKRVDIVKTINQKHEISFNNASLVDVLNDLSNQFNVKIQYTKADIEKISFTGIINLSDDIKSVLKIITQMNNLEITETADGFMVLKAK